MSGRLSTSSPMRRASSAGASMPIMCATPGSSTARAVRRIRGEVLRGGPALRYVEVAGDGQDGCDELAQSTGRAGLQPDRLARDAWRVPDGAVHLQHGVPDVCRHPVRGLARPVDPDRDIEAPRWRRRRRSPRVGPSARTARPRRVSAPARSRRRLRPPPTTAATRSGCSMADVDRDLAALRVAHDDRPVDAECVQDGQRVRPVGDTATSSVVDRPNPRRS